MKSERHCYQTHRYLPGYWNGLALGKYRAQYFNVQSEDRVIAMLDIVRLLRRNRIRFTAKIWKRYFRILITGKDYDEMPAALKEQILRINIEHMKNW